MRRASRERDALRQQLEERSTEELVSILRNRDEEEWRPEVFEIVASILEGRGVAPPTAIELGPEGSDVVESQELVTVTRYFSPAEAHAFRAALEEAGLKAWVLDEILGTFYGVGVGARVQVRPEDYEAARSILESEPVPASALPPELAEPPCPRCGGNEVSQEAAVPDHVPPFPRESSRRQWHYQCATCGNEWTSE